MLCERLLPQVSARTAAGLGVVLHRLTAPLQVAVAGRLKSGKSTLVNALIGRRVAPTAVGECTRLVTRFRYGTVDRVEVVRTDGQRQVLPFQSDGGIPSDIGHLVGGIDRVSHLDAYLTSDLLRELTVIDTPGLGSLDAASVSRTEAVLGSAGGGLDPVSTSAVAGAEAVVYVVTQSVRSDDRQALAAFLAATA
ncbi:MAG TPA: dynamin family protein, partial [Pseudonocardiaceae bacterium]